MTSHQRELERRRQRLVERSTAQRAALGALLAPVVAKVATVDRVRNTLRKYPVGVVAIAAGFGVLGWQGTLSLAARLFSLYALLRRT